MFSASDQYLGGVRPVRLPRRLEQLDALEDVALSVRDDRPLLLTGNVGTGKTTLMAEVDLWTESRTSRTKLERQRFPLFVLPNVAPDETWRSRFNLWTSAQEYCDDIKATFGKTMRSCETQAAGARRLFLDDLGVERNTAQNHDAVTGLIIARHMRDLPTWVTTNLSLAEIRDRYGERIFSRLFDKALLVELNGADRRMGLFA